MLQKNQSGFGAVEGLLVVLVLAVIGFGGYYVWHTQKGTDKYSTTNKSSSAQKTTSPTSTKETAGNTNTASQQKYLVIKEWGVKIPLSSSISTAYYLYDSDSNVNFVRVSLDKYKGTNCAADQGMLSTIVRSTDPNYVGENSTSTDVTVGNYYYFYVHPQGPCDGGAVDEETSSTTGQDEAMSYIPYIKDAIDHIVAN